MKHQALHYTQPITRRDFLKTSTVAASAAAVGTLDLSRSAHAAGSDIIKVGMIGCGGRNSGAAGQALTRGPRRAAGRHVRHLPRPHRDRRAGAVKQAKGDAGDGG